MNSNLQNPNSNLGYVANLVPMFGEYNNNNAGSQGTITEEEHAQLAADLNRNETQTAPPAQTAPHAQTAQPAQLVQPVPPVQPAYISGRNSGYKNNRTEPEYLPAIHETPIDRTLLYNFNFKFHHLLMTTDRWLYKLEELIQEIQENAEQTLLDNHSRDIYVSNLTDRLHQLRKRYKPMSAEKMREYDDYDSKLIDYEQAILEYNRQLIRQQEEQQRQEFERRRVLAEQRRREAAERREAELFRHFGRGRRKKGSQKKKKRKSKSKRSMRKRQRSRRRLRY